MSLPTPEFILQQLQWRYATKKFDPTKIIPESTWHLLEQSLVLSPSSFGLQPWKFFVVRNPEIRHKLVEHSWGQKQVVEASHLVVLAINKNIDDAEIDRYIASMAEIRNTSVENLVGLANTIKGFLKKFSSAQVDDWATRQTYIALGFYMTCAAVLGIDTCPIEGFIPEQYDRVLGLTEQGYASVVVCPAGYRAEDDKYATMPKVRYETEQVVEYID
jgi:nitroreductase